MIWLLCDVLRLLQVASTLSVSASGDYTALGTLGGSVGVYDTHTFRRLHYAPETHSIFVTNVCVLPTPIDARRTQLLQRQTLDAQKRQAGRVIGFKLYEIVNYDND